MTAEPRRDLTAHDFTDDLRIVFQDGSIMHFNWARIEKEAGTYWVYTEHCGYFQLNEQVIHSIDTDADHLPPPEE